jgi:hypothetical protein
VRWRLGGDDLFDEGWFLWIDGSAVTNWLPGQPDDPDGVQDCVKTAENRSELISDATCATADRYICEIPLEKNV